MDDSPPSVWLSLPPEIIAHVATVGPNVIRELRTICHAWNDIVTPSVRTLVFRDRPPHTASHIIRVFEWARCMRVPDDVGYPQKQALKHALNAFARAHEDAVLDIPVSMVERIFSRLPSAHSVRIHDFSAYSLDPYSCKNLKIDYANTILYESRMMLILEDGYVDTLLMLRRQLSNGGELGRLMRRCRRIVCPGLTAMPNDGTLTRSANICQLLVLTPLKKDWQSQNSSASMIAEHASGTGLQVVVVPFSVDIYMLDNNGLSDSIASPSAAWYRASTGSMEQ